MLSESYTYSDAKHLIKKGLNFPNKDSVLLILTKSNYNSNCSLCDTNELKINIVFQVIAGSSNGCPIPSLDFCENLVYNGGLENFNPLPLPTNNNNTEYIVSEDWPSLQMLEDVTCGWNYEFYNSVMEIDFKYLNRWFDDPINQAACAFSAQQVGFNPPCTPYLPSNFSSFELAGIDCPFYCGFQPQLSNYYFQNNNDAFVRGNINYISRVMRGNLTSPLVQYKKYYLEVNVAHYNTDGFGGGVLNVDISENANYVQAQYATTPPTLSVDAFDFIPSINGGDSWKKVNTIFEAGGNEMYIYVGNLNANSGGSAGVAAGTITTNQSPYCFTGVFGNSSPFYSDYLFDNFVVKEFAADAGIGNIILCEGERYQVQPTICPFENAVYNWQPAIYFDNNTLANPTITIPPGSGLSNVTCSLTVTITMANGSTATTDPSFVDITIIQGNSITITGPTTVVNGGSTILDLTDGTNYSWTGSDGSSGSSATNTSINTGNLTQDVTYTINATSSAGCSVTEVVTVTVTQLPASCISDPNYPNTKLIPDGTDYNGFLGIMGLSSGLPNYNIVNTNFALEGTFTIDLNTPISFTNCHFYCYDAARLYIQSGDVVLRTCTLEACNNTLWKGIQNGGKLSMSDCLVKDARDGILIEPQSKNFIADNTFIDNYIGINIFGDCIFQNQNNKFSNPNPLLPHWLGWNLPKAQCGIRISDATNISIDVLPMYNNQFTEFKNINCGILCYNTNLTVNNAYFENIYDQFGANNTTDGSGIYIQGTVANSLQVLPFTGVNQSTTFKNCNVGIYHEGCNTKLNYLGMENVRRGIVGVLLMYCTNWMEYNNINAALYGIEMKMIDDVDLLVINHNNIFAQDKKAGGIVVAGFDNNASQNSNIKIQDNTVEIVDGAAGIEVNNIFHPKVNMNKIYHSIQAPITQASTWNGIRTTNCFKADISCNETFQGSGLGHSTFGADIYLSQSQSTRLACNYTKGNSNIGIFLSSENQNSIIQTNEIGSHNIGLYLDNSCVIGKQPNGQFDAPHANKWNGSYNNTQYGGAAAVNTNIWTQGSNPTLLMSLIEYNQFKVNPPSNTQPFWPQNYPDNTFGTNWFVSTSISALDPCTGGYCLHLENDGGDEENPSMALNTSIALGLIQTTGYPQETKWMLRRGLVTELSRNDSLLNANDTMQVFYFGINQENLKKLQQIADTLAAVKLINQAVIEAMQGNDSIMNMYNDALQALLPLMDDSLLTDSISTIYEQLQNQYKTIADINEQLSNQMINERNQAGVQGLMLNTSIVPNNFNEYLERQVNDIYLHTYGQGVDTLSAADIATLQYVIHICPQAGGPSIYKARALYMMVNDTMVYNDSVVCRNAGYFRESQELLMPELIEKNIKATFSIYPNPAKDKLVVLIEGKLEEGTINVYNALGKHVNTFTILKDTQRKELDINSWAEGFYIITFSSANLNAQQSFIKLK